MTDYSTYAPSASDPASFAAEVTPDDDADLVEVPRALWIGTAGDISVTMAGGGTVTFANISAGWHPLRVTRVMATGTTASDIVAVW